MDRSSEDLLGFTVLDDLPPVHDGHMTRKAPDDREIMGDEKDCHAEFGLQFPQLVEDLFLDGDIKCRGWLVGDQKVGDVRKGPWRS